MEDKYNQLHLERYSKELANMLCDRHFASHDTINGPQLLHFVPIKQVNLFVIKELLLKWHQEMANLRSPYFDFENEDVKEALLNFMNVLSRKIRMKRNAFEPLLQKAIYDTFLVVLAPSVTLEEKFLRIQEEITLPKLQENLKYIDIDKALFAGFIETLSSSSRDREYILSRFKLYLNAHQGERTTIEQLAGQFNALLPLNAEELVKPDAAPLYTPEAAKPTPAAPVEEVDIVAPIHMAQREASIVTPPAPAPKPADHNLNERFKAERPTLNENFRKAASSLADTHSNQKIDSLKNAISINQRFSFINELFEGDNLTYYQAIQSLDAMTSADQATRFITHDLAGKYDWSKKQDHVNKLLRLVERKFA
ncbi:hypothetical protein H8S95_09015 [Pontibacter sp. KCTC 32443]|uniref:hypothetical protein n=1 Tax=Pontibacter TaxID=323449 RepID=UPI00164E0AF1|nr:MULTISPECIES: hypothetical protein [Pontibacter]MBC5774201.1 hypothetical protein [Pontibacter sp. KCTC 32443]